MKRISLIFQEYLPQATKIEAGIIQYLMNHIDEAGQMGIRQMAQRVYASSSTITRLCHKLGYQGYRDFQKALMVESAFGKEIISEENAAISREDSVEQTVSKIIYQTVESLEGTGNLIDPAVLKKSVEVLDGAGKVCFLGMGASLLVAKDAYLKFLRVEKNCEIADDFHTQLVQVQNLRPTDVAVIISYSGMTQEMVTCARILHSRSVPVIAITRLQESQLSALADYNLYVTATEFTLQTGKLSSRITQLAVVDMLYTLYVQKNYDRCMASLRRTYIPKLEKKALPGRKSSDDGNNDGIDDGFKESDYGNTQ